ncbi:MAG: hypothetical protein M0T80_12330, partial [Actinomycetota bacterium]|nr:hypothetical protein [Actinomycetota bacterium]
MAVFGVPSTRGVVLMGGVVPVGGVVLAGGVVGGVVVGADAAGGTGAVGTVGGEDAGAWAVGGVAALGAGRRRVQPGSIQCGSSSTAPPGWGRPSLRA